MGERKISLKKNIVLNYIKTLSGLIFPLITFPYFSKILKPEGLGTYNFAVSITSYFTLIAGLGIYSYAIKQAASVRDNKDELSKLVSEMFSINLISTAVSFVLFIGSLFIIPKFFDYRIILLVCAIPFVTGSFGMEYLFNAVEDFTYITLRSIILQTITVVFLFIFVRSPDDIILYSLINSGSVLFQNILNFFSAKKYVKINIFQKLELAKHLKPIFILFALSIASSVYSILDTSMLGFISGEVEVGYYSAATKINRMVLSVVASMSSVFLPRLAYLTKNGQKDEYKNMINKSFELIILIAFPCTVGLFMVSEPIIMLLSGQEYVSAIPVMKIMNPIVLIVGLSCVTGTQVLFTQGKEKKVLYSVIAGTVLNFILNMILIPRINSMGAAIASVCAEICVTSLQLIFGAKYFNVSKVILNLIKYGLMSLVMAVAVYFAMIKFENDAIKCLAGISTGVVSYLICLAVTKNKFLFDILRKFKKNKAVKND